LVLLCWAVPAAAADNAQTSGSGATLASSEPRGEPYHFQNGLACPFCVLTPQEPGGRSGLHWHDHWRVAGVREYVTIAGLVAAFGLQSMLVPAPTKPRWNHPILFDDPVRDALRIRGAKGRRTAGTVSDMLFYWEVAHPSLIDPLLVAWWQRKAPVVAWQMVVIDAQAYALTLLITDATKRFTARSRPWVGTSDCERDPTANECGGGGRYYSFSSGHSAITATGAGLICAHHTQLSLYQNDVLDVGTCALAVAGTAVTGAMRIASDNHWASDVIVGHLIGYVSGYVLPTALYYRQFRSQPERPHESAPVFAALPLVTGQALGLTVLGQF
jgi:membrane-associated phospholipid phosphatase